MSKVKYYDGSNWKVVGTYADLVDFSPQAEFMDAKNVGEAFTKIWNTWKQQHKITEGNGGAMNMNNMDLNAVTSTGFYFGRGMKSMPSLGIGRPRPDAQVDCYLEVIQPTTGSNFTMQRLTETLGGDVWVRVKLDGNWRAWEKQINDGAIFWYKMDTFDGDYGDGHGTYGHYAIDNLGVKHIIGRLRVNKNIAQGDQRDKLVYTLPAWMHPNENRQITVTAGYTDTEKDANDIDRALDVVYPAVINIVWGGKMMLRTPLSVPQSKYVYFNATYI